MTLRKVNSAQLASAAGYDKSLVTKWSQGKHVSPKLARDTALALNAPVLDAFIAAGYLTPEDTRAKVVERPIKLLSNEELLAEVGHRMKGARGGVADQTEPSASPEGDQGEEATSAEELNQRARDLAILNEGLSPQVVAGKDFSDRAAQRQMRRF